MREKILLVGDSNTSKTFSLVKLAVLYPESKVVIFDADDGTSKLLAELKVELPNLILIPVTFNWKELMDNYKMVKGILTEKDWFCMDMMGRFWDFAQNYYSREVFGEDPSEHILQLKRQAKAVNFGGFEGLQDWTVIKRLHNENLVDDAVLHSKFNVMCTTSVSQFSPKEKVPTSGTMGIYASAFGVKPEGEKHNIYRFDSQLFLFRKKDNTYWFRIVRDRGRPVDVQQEFEVTGKSVFEVYRDFRLQQGIQVGG